MQIGYDLHLSVEVIHLIIDHHHLIGSCDVTCFLVSEF